MNKEISHQEYYAQFVTKSILDTVRRCIGTSRILKSEDQHFNDIDLKSWDNLYVINWGSLSDSVCVAKAAARIIKEQGK
jgi:hypothetical protein